MNDKDNEEFKYWLENNTTTQEEIEAYEAMSEKDRVMFCMKYTWRAACLYKQKEIDDLLKQLKHEHDLYKKHLKVYKDEYAELREQDQILGEEIKTYMAIAEKLQFENSKLKHRMELIRLR